MCFKFCVQSLVEWHCFWNSRFKSEVLRLHAVDPADVHLLLWAQSFCLAHCIIELRFCSWCECELYRLWDCYYYLLLRGSSTVSVDSVGAVCNLSLDAVSFLWDLPNLAGKINTSFICWLRPFKSNEFGKALRTSAADMLEALEHNDLHEDLPGDFLGDLLADLGLQPDSDSQSAMHALGTVQTWWKKPEYALWHFWGSCVAIFVYSWMWLCLND